MVSTFFFQRNIKKKTVRTKKWIKWIQAKLQSIPLPQFPGKEKALYAYYKINLNFLSKQCTRMSNWNKWAASLTFSICNAAISDLYLFFLFLNQNFFIFGIIKYSHVPSSELYSNCILLGGELWSHLRCSFTMCYFSLKGIQRVLSSSLLNHVVLCDSLFWGQETKCPELGNTNT